MFSLVWGGLGSAGTPHQTDFFLNSSNRGCKKWFEAAARVAEVRTQLPLERTKQPLANEAGDMPDGQSK